MNTPVVNVSVIGFFTVLVLWTLNGNSGQDMNDVVVQYWEAKLAQLEAQSDTL